jgi:hypothetical protein
MQQQLPRMASGQEPARHGSRKYRYAISARKRNEKGPTGTSAPSRSVAFSGITN